MRKRRQIITEQIEHEYLSMKAIPVTVNILRGNNHGSESAIRYIVELSREYKMQYLKRHYLSR